MFSIILYFRYIGQQPPLMRAATFYSCHILQHKPYFFFLPFPFLSFPFLLPPFLPLVFPTSPFPFLFHYNPTYLLPLLTRPSLSYRGRQSTGGEVPPWQKCAWPAHRRVSFAKGPNRAGPRLAPHRTGFGQPSWERQPKK